MSLFLLRKKTQNKTITIFDVVLTFITWNNSISGKSTDPDQVCSKPISYIYNYEVRKIKQKFNNCPITPQYR